MSMRARVGLLGLWVASLGAVAALAAAQAPSNQREPAVISGADLGFRVEGMQRGFPVGKLVVRIDGQWVEVVVAAP